MKPSFATSFSFLPGSTPLSSDESISSPTSLDDSKVYAKEPWVGIPLLLDIAAGG
jgi:hypothetical protein